MIILKCVSGCILINTASHEAVSFDDADKFCKKLDQTAQLLEIHAKDQLDFINVLLSILHLLLNIINKNND